MPRIVKCSCGKQMRVKDELIGKRVKCPGCGKGVVVPGPTEPVQDQSESGSVREDNQPSDPLAPLAPMLNALVAMASFNALSFGYLAMQLFRLGNSGSSFNWRINAMIN